MTIDLLDPLTFGLAGLALILGALFWPARSRLGVWGYPEMEITLPRVLSAAAGVFLIVAALGGWIL